MRELQTENETIRRELAAQKAALDELRRIVCAASGANACRKQ